MGRLGPTRHPSAAWRHERKFFSADPTRDVGWPCRSGKHGGEYCQDMIADGMTEGVVDPLEAVEVEGEQRNRTSNSFASFAT